MVELKQDLKKNLYLCIKDKNNNFAYYTLVDNWATEYFILKKDHFWFLIPLHLLEHFPA